MYSHDDWRSQINSEVADFFNLLQEEHQIPPMFSCLHLGGFCFANIIAAYGRADKDPPKELLDFMNHTFPLMMKDHEEMIVEQYLTLNTEGTS